MSAHDARLLQALCKEDLFAFVWQCFLHLHPGDQQAFIPNWHVRAICHALERVARGECRRLLITVPPRHLKSICTAVGFAAWLLGRDPSLRIMVASYGHDLASRHSQHCRAVMESPFYRQLFPHTELRTARELELVTTANGGRKAVSLGGSATGFGADILIIDDLMKACGSMTPHRLPSCHHSRSSASSWGESMALRSLRPLPCSTRISMRVLSMSSTLRLATSETRRPAP